MAVEEALEALRSREPVLLYDFDDREGETDIIIPAESIGWKDVRFLRNEAGGLVCVALPFETAERFDLPLLAEVFEGSGAAPEYDDRSSFSLTVNHESSYTGVTDRDRATTIHKVAEAVGEPGFDFSAEFRFPGHVNLLVAAEDLMEERQGHTEMAVSLARRAGITPAVVVCEMLDDETGNALSKEKAERYADENGLVFLKGEQIR